MDGGQPAGTPTTAPALEAVARSARPGPALVRTLSLYGPLALVVAAAVALDLSTADHLSGGAGRGPVLSVGVALSVVGGLGVLGIPSTLRRRRATNRELADVDDMTGPEFERWLAQLLADLDYVVATTPATGDYGADLITERGGVRSVLQAKRYDGAVGIEAVQQVIGARRYYGADAAAVVTNSHCTPAAWRLAVADDVVVVDRDGLCRLMARRARRRGRRWALAGQVGAGLVLVAVGSLAVVRIVGRLLVGLLRLLAR